MWIIVYFCIVSFFQRLEFHHPNSFQQAPCRHRAKISSWLIRQQFQQQNRRNTRFSHRLLDSIPQGTISSSRSSLVRLHDDYGDVFTSPKVACYILDLIGYTPDKNLSQYNILEPSCGDGVFVIEIIHCILMSARHQCSRPDWQQTELEWRISTKSI